MENCPKRSQSSLYLRIGFYQNSLKSCQLFWLLYKEIYFQELSKIAQSGHTGRFTSVKLLSYSKNAFNIGGVGIASGNSTSIPWTLSSSEAEHEYGATTTSSSGAENSPRAVGSLPKFQRYKSDLTSASYHWPVFQNHHEDEDLIQKVSDVRLTHDNDRFGKTSNDKTSNARKRQKQVNRDERTQLSSMQLAILVREKLNKECINLGSPHFNAKVRR